MKTKHTFGASIFPLAMALSAGIGAAPVAAALSTSVRPTEIVSIASVVGAAASREAVPDEPQPDMAWWREARFGMFIHWGLYSIPAGKWGDKTSHGEWIRDTAQIPVGEYDTFITKFNPTKFNADEWVKLAQEAGMGYMVITSKHHDGFSLFDTKQSDFDVMATPFKRDIIRELADACARTQGSATGRELGGAPASAPAEKSAKKIRPVVFGIYHSIMDWHHPDYVPRRPWEKAARPEAGADFDRYVAYMKEQIRELLTNYGPMGVLWFDGQWEGTWNNERGTDLQKFVRSLQPRIIINSRVGRGGGAYGLEPNEHGERLGDYGTPEQFIPETNPGIDWETCMTMNGHWGYNAVDKNFKSTTDLVQKLCDIASKGGNFLLNVGPTAEGEIPPESIERLKEIGEWMMINGQAIRGTQASPLPVQPSWGRVTMRPLDNGNTLLYLHVFEMPEEEMIAISGLLNKPLSAGLLQDTKSSVFAQVPVQESDGIIVLDLKHVGAGAITGLKHAIVFTLEVQGEPDPSTPPSIEAFSSMFVDPIAVEIRTVQKNTETRYTLDGSLPTMNSPLYAGPITIKDNAMISARAFRDGQPITSLGRARFTRAAVRASLPKAEADAMKPGLKFDCYEGDWSTLPIFDTLTPTRSEVAPDLTLSRVTRDDQYGVRFTGYINVPKTDVYTFYLASDDGSRMLLSGSVLIDHDGLHSETEKTATVALDAGVHAIRIEMFEKSGGAALSLKWATATTPKQRVPASAWRSK